LCGKGAVQGRLACGVDVDHDRENWEICDGYFRHELELMKISTLSTGLSSRRRRPAVAIVALTGLAALAGVPAVARAARVSGTLTRFESMAPEPSRDLHFQNVVTQDTYLSPSHKDGSFAATLPPGVYDIRTESGVILKNSVVVGDNDVGVGTVHEPGPYTVRRIFERQAIAPSILTSPAPSTAFIMTVDQTVVSANAQLVPKRQINWSKTPTDETREMSQTPLTPVAPRVSSGGSSGMPGLGLTPATPGNPMSQPPSP
jgi:hypothetical protein